MEQSPDLLQEPRCIAIGTQFAKRPYYTNFLLHFACNTGQRIRLTLVEDLDAESKSNHMTMLSWYRPVIEG